MTRQFLNPEEVAQMLGLSVQTLAKWRSEGNGPPYFKVGERVRYAEFDVRQWLGQQRVPPEAG